MQLTLFFKLLYCESVIYSYTAALVRHRYTRPCRTVSGWGGGGGGGGIKKLGPLPFGDGLAPSGQVWGCYTPHPHTPVVPALLLQGLRLNLAGNYFVKRGRRKTLFQRYLTHR